MAFYGGLKALLWADIVAGYVMWAMMPYLTDVWNLNFTLAAGILNLWQGMVSVLPFGFAFLMGTILGYFPMLMISTIFFGIGLGFLSISTPPVLGACKAYKSECIGQAQKIIYFAGLVQMAVGLSGHTVALLPFFRFQVEENSPIRDYSGRANAFEFAQGFAILVGPITGSLLPIYAKDRWSILFGVPAILYLVATILFFIGIRWYHPMEKEGSPFTKVEEMKTAIHMIPMALPFIICGLVSSIGNTYFVEQANHMNRKVGKIKVPLFMLLIIFELSKLLFLVLYACITTWMETRGRKKYAPPIGIALAMVLSILCCVTASKVETRRLNVVKSHGLLDNPKATVPMSMFWLVPQFFLLAGVSSFLEQSVVGFFNDQVPSSMRDYLEYFRGGVFGFGTIGSVLSVHVVGKISEKGRKIGWFQETLNKSRLDKYYLVLAALSAANLVFYVLVATLYPYNEISEVEEEEEEDFTNGVFPVGMPVVYG